MIKLIFDKTESITNWYHISVDGSLMEKARAHCSNVYPDPAYDITSQDSDTSAKILNHSLTDFPRLNYMSLRYTFDWSEIFKNISIWGSRDDSYELVFLAEPDLGKLKALFDSDKGAAL